MIFSIEEEHLNYMLNRFQDFRKALEIRAYRRQHYYDRVCEHHYQNDDKLRIEKKVEFNEKIYEEEMYFEDLKFSVKNNDEEMTLMHNENERKDAN